MSELLDTARQLLRTTSGHLYHGVDDGVWALPATVPYADYVRRFELPGESGATATHASAVAQVLRLGRTLETLNSLALAHASRAGAHDSDHLYQAHGDPRD